MYNAHRASMDRRARDRLQGALEPEDRQEAEVILSHGLLNITLKALAHGRPSTNLTPAPKKAREGFLTDLGPVPQLLMGLVNIYHSPSVFSSGGPLWRLQRPECCFPQLLCKVTLFFQSTLPQKVCRKSKINRSVRGEGRF